MIRSILCTSFLTVSCLAAPLPEIPQIRNYIPPKAKVATDSPAVESLRSRLQELRPRAEAIDLDRPGAIDTFGLFEAVDFTVREGRFYDEKRLALMERDVLGAFEKRLQELDSPGENEFSWRREPGIQWRAFRSRVDDSIQPFGVYFPEAYDSAKPLRVMVWLHGRGDTLSKAAFYAAWLRSRKEFMGKGRELAQTLIVYPYGRMSNGFKFAGSTDVYEVLDIVERDYPVDRESMILSGFSMGGAGVWHMGAHQQDRFIGFHPGAGFVAPKGQQKSSFRWQKRLDTMFEIAPYAENFFDANLMAYIGSKDRNQMARTIMGAAFQEFDRELPLIVGEGAGHTYTPQAAAQLASWMRDLYVRGKESPLRVVWKTPWLQFGKKDWVEITGLAQQGRFGRIEADWTSPELLRVQTDGITSFRLTLPDQRKSFSELRIEVDGQQLNRAQGDREDSKEITISRQAAGWKVGELGAAKQRKRPGLQGPIDDAFSSRFLFVPPSEPEPYAKAERWLKFEYQGALQRWRNLMQGEVRMKEAGQIDEQDISSSHLILWGSPDSNPMIRKIAEQLPVKWEGERFTMRGERYSRETHIPILIFPNPLNPETYVVLNSGHTFRQEHDRSNSFQYPRLPDWAVIGLERLPDGNLPGHIESAGFFDEFWK